MGAPWGRPFSRRHERRPYPRSRTDCLDSNQKRELTGHITKRTCDTSNLGMLASGGTLRSDCDTLTSRFLAPLRARGAGERFGLARRPLCATLLRGRGLILLLELAHTRCNGALARVELLPGRFGSLDGRRRRARFARERQVMRLRSNRGA